MNTGSAAGQLASASRAPLAVCHPLAVPLGLRVGRRRPMNRDVDCHEVPGTPGPFLVDGFKHVRSHPQTRSYFLSHYHSDHYTGLREGSEFGAGLIHCSPTTARLLVAMHGLPPDRVRPHALRTPFAVEGVTVTFVDANHCPGAVLLLFEAEGKAVLHCGDMRYHDAMREELALQRVCGRLDAVFLDTTYSEEKHAFPPQSASISSIVAEVQKRAPIEPRAPASAWTCLILLGAYTIGKEKVLLEVAKSCGLPIYVDPRKHQVMQQLQDELSPAEMALFVTDPKATPLHVCKMNVCGTIWPFFQPDFARIRQYISEGELPFTSTLAVLPTGWADSSNWNRTHGTQTNGEVTVMAVPYSEHSNFGELQSFVGWLRPTQLVPTVYSNLKGRAKIQRKFSALVNATDAKRHFLARFGAKAAAAPVGSGAAAAKQTAAKAEPPVDGSSQVAAATAEAQDEVGADGPGPPSSASAQSSGEDWADAEAEWDRICLETDQQAESDQQQQAERSGGVAPAKEKETSSPAAAREDRAGPPAGVDSQVWRELPEGIRRELLAEHRRQSAADEKEKHRCSSNGIASAASAASAAEPGSAKRQRKMGEFFK